MRIIQLLFVGFLIYYLVRLLKKLFLSKPPQKPAPENGTVTEEMVRDPECGTYLPQSQSLKWRWKGTKYHFCSEECKNKFISRIKK